MHNAIKFTQFRFKCEKNRTTRALHIKTKQNALGFAVVDNFIGASATLPASCGSFEVLDGDNSTLGRDCEKWNVDTGTWLTSHHEWNPGLFSHPMWISGIAHWNVAVNGIWGVERRFECDDYKRQITAGDIWEVYVR